MREHRSIDKLPEQWEWKAKALKGMRLQTCYMEFRNCFVARRRNKRDWVSAVDIVWRMLKGMPRACIMGYRHANVEERALLEGGFA